MADENEIEVRFGANVGGLVEGCGQAREAIEGLNETFKHLAELAGVALSVDAFKDWVDSSAELGEQMQRTAAMLGVSAQQASQLSGMAKLTGTDFGSLTHIMERFELGLDTAGLKTSRVGQALQALGLNAREFIGVPLPQQLDVMAEAFSRFADGPNKTAAAMALLGRAGAEMLPFLDRGKEGMQELQDVLDRTGAVMSNEMAASFAATKEDIEEMSLAWQGFSNKLFDAVNPAIDAAIKEIAHLLESMSVSGIRAGVQQIADVAIDLTSTITQYAVRATAAVQDMIASFGGLSHVAGELEKLNAITEPGHFHEGMNALFDLLGGPEGGPEDTGAAKAADTLDAKLKAIQDAAKSAKANMDAAFAGAPSMAPELDMINGGKPQTPQMDFSDAKEQAKQAADAIKQAFGDAFKSAGTDAKDAVQDINNALKLHGITAQQAAQQTIAALEKEAAAVAEATQKALDATNLTATQRSAIEDRELEKIKEIAQQEKDVQVKAAEAVQKQYEQMADTIAGAMNSQVDGLLRGTTSIAQASKNMAASMIEDWIKFEIKSMAEDSARVAAHVAGAGTMVAADQAANAAGLGGIVANAAKAVEAFAGEVAAGVTAFLAPIIGPAAPAAGLAAAATVVDMGTAFYDTGAWSVPQDMYAGIHQGEMVVPQRGGVADEFRSFMSGGGFGGGKSVTVSPTMHFHNSPYDDSGFERLLNGNGGRLMKAVDRAVRDGAHLGLRGLRR